VVIYSNSVCGARSNFEGGPSALAAGLTGRTPRYGFHLPEFRRGTLRIQVDYAPTTLNGWGALGGAIAPSRRQLLAVPVVEGIEGRRSDQPATSALDGELWLHCAVSSDRADAGSRQVG
jgi:predicted aconitase